MAFDGIVTNAVTNELKQLLLGGRILKIYQPTSTELIFQIRNNRINHHLLLSAHSSYARIHLTETKLQNPTQPPMFLYGFKKIFNWQFY